MVLKARKRLQYLLVAWLCVFLHDKAGFWGVAEISDVFLFLRALCGAVRTVVFVVPHQQAVLMEHVHRTIALVALALHKAALQQA